MVRPYSAADLATHYDDFGPWVGLFTGGVGNLIGDYISGYGVFWNWDVGNGLVGFIAGLAMLITWGRYFSTRNIIILIGDERAFELPEGFSARLARKLEAEWQRK